jgi:hypothetical protein
MFGRLRGDTEVCADRGRSGHRKDHVKLDVLGVRPYEEACTPTGVVIAASATHVEFPSGGRSSIPPSATPAPGS